MFKRYMLGLMLLCASWGASAAGSYVCAIEVDPPLTTSTVTGNYGSIQVHYDTTAACTTAYKPSFKLCTSNATQPDCAKYVIRTENALLQTANLLERAMLEGAQISGGGSLCIGGSYTCWRHVIVQKP